MCRDPRTPLSGALAKNTKGHSNGGGRRSASARPAGLVDLIVGTDGNGPEVPGVVDPGRLIGGGGGDEVVDGPEAEAAVVEDGIEDLHHARKDVCPMSTCARTN